MRRWGGGRTRSSSMMGAPQVVLIGTGSEVQVCLAAADILLDFHGRSAARVVRPVPGTCCRSQASTRPGGGPPRRASPAWPWRRPASFGWERYADATVCIDHFGGISPGSTTLERVRVHPRERGHPCHGLIAAPGGGPVDKTTRGGGRRARPGLPGGAHRPPTTARGRGRMTDSRTLRPAGAEPVARQPATRSAHGGDASGLVDEGIRGVTSNPTIFEKAIAGRTPTTSSSAPSSKPSRWRTHTGRWPSTTSTAPWPSSDTVHALGGAPTARVASRCPRPWPRKPRPRSPPPAPPRSDRPAQSVGQSAGDPRRRTGGEDPHRRGSQHQRDAHLQHRPLRGGHRGLLRRARDASRPG